MKIQKIHLSTIHTFTCCTNLMSLLFNSAEKYETLMEMLDNIDNPNMIDAEFLLSLSSKKAQMYIIQLWRICKRKWFVILRSV